ncbi:MAG: ribonuclease R [Alphaproteobacteria bacterium]|nr:ribonuclease R [Alphaproteobacteria bacterium]MBU1512835.1 ribonuclease R [Alphaproteobacteria bacterium]MBU2095729.1 ribonuclease R [Alphaproteobacteria bacterium]MBU2153185.1 ribonuclease R [Alphaproteobacteria bacterium]MBU2362880.1 ribonuclease R [Alphaproteobacteria bacterium]
MPKTRAPKATRFNTSSARPAKGVPDRETLLKFIRESGETDKGAIARAFGLKGEDRRALRAMLQTLETDGTLGKRGRKGFAEAGALPEVGVVDVVERTSDGDLMVKLTKGDDAPMVALAPGGDAKAGAPGMGDRLLVRFVKLESGETEARLIKRLGQSSHRILGVVRKSRREVRVEPVDRRTKETLLLPEGENVRDGDLVVAQIESHGSRYGPKHGKLLEIVGREDDPRAYSIIAIHAHGIPTGFPEGAEAEAEAAEPPTLSGREDLRQVPLITIDPADARDHDDAVYAEPDTDEKNPGGWICWVAIADVAAYVRPGSELDRTAREKGNSVYFPDRVEPMLPERLSNGLCSLREGENRATMAVRMVFGADGRKRSHTFVRGLMRSAAKLSYEQAQAAIDGNPDDKTGPLLEPVLRPLWAAYACLKKGRDARSPLGIESLERKISINTEGEIAQITPRASLEAHKLIEEFMIQANVSAAETLEQKRTPLIYRIHDQPSQEKIQALVDFLGTLGLPWTKGEVPRTERFNKLLAETREGPHADIVNEVVLRTQMQAVYSTENIGHYGLNLAKYAHFTSPIRRYADLIVHRALVSALGLGTDGLSDRDISQMKDTAESITFAERRAMAAERDAMDRYVAAFLSDRVGAEFEGRITGVTRFGLFVRLAETGADGLVPVSKLGGEFFIHDDRSHALVGERSGARWPLGMTVTVRLEEATPITGGLLFHMLSEPAAPDRTAPRPRLGMRARNDRRPGGKSPTGRPPGIRTGRKQKMGGKKR